MLADRVRMSVKNTGKKGVLFDYGKYSEFWEVGYLGPGAVLGNTVDAEKKDNKLKLTSYGSSVSGYSISFATINNIDITNYSVLKVISETNGQLVGNIRFGILNDRTNIDFLEEYEYLDRTKEDEVVEIDISSFEGEYYIGLALNGAMNLEELSIYKVFLE